jgi:hypothetical protein
MQARANYAQSYNMSFEIINDHSGGSKVKTVIDTILNICDRQESQLFSCPSDPPSSSSSTTTIQPPEEECYVLSNWATNPYNKLVITSNQGIPALLRAMRVFSSCAGLVECCCLALGNLCRDNLANQNLVRQAGGVEAILIPMKENVHSVAIVSAGCDALYSMSQILISSPVATQEFAVEMLAHARQMYLPNRHRMIAENLLILLIAQPHTATECINAR